MAHPSSQSNSVCLNLTNLTISLYRYRGEEIETQKGHPTCPKSHSRCRIGLKLKPGFQILNFSSSHYPNALELSQNTNCPPLLFQRLHCPQPTHTFRSYILESASCKNWTHFLTLYWVCFLGHVLPQTQAPSSCSAFPSFDQLLLGESPSALFGTKSHPWHAFNQEPVKKTKLQFKKYMLILRLKTKSQHTKSHFGLNFRRP